MFASVSGDDEDRADALFHALADRTRRDILRRSVDGELSVSALAEAYPMSFAAVQKHVAVLEKVGLVTKRKQGRALLVRSEPSAVDRARRALDQLAEIWQGRVERMAALLDEPDTTPRTEGH